MFPFFWVWRMRLRNYRLDSQQSTIRTPLPSQLLFHRCSRGENPGGGGFPKIMGMRSMMWWKIQKGFHYFRGLSHFYWEVLWNFSWRGPICNTPSPPPPLCAPMFCFHEGEVKKCGLAFWVELHLHHKWRIPGGKVIKAKLDKTNFRLFIFVDCEQKL